MTRLRALSRALARWAGWLTCSLVLAVAVADLTSRRGVA